MQKLKILRHKIWSKAVSSVVNLFAIQTNFDTANTVLLIGSARSGTTFLMESLNANNEYRIIFEPFSPTYTKEWNSFSARHYIDPKNVKEEEKQVIDSIIRGKINNKWVDQYNRKIKSERRLIKSVRANLMLDYFEKEYPEILIVYIYRNPYAVVASRINLNFDPQDVHLILEHKVFLKNHYGDIDISALKLLLDNPESCHAALWCFENRFIFKDSRERPIIQAKFEDIIGKTVKLEKDGLVVTDKIRRPSVTSSLQKAYQLSEKEIGNVSIILNYFGISEYGP